LKSDEREYPKNNPCSSLKYRWGSLLKSLNTQVKFHSGRKKIQIDSTEEKKRGQPVPKKKISIYESGLALE
jgi:hypothetical protein